MNNGKNINMAAVQKVRNMVTVLNCHIEDLLEIEINDVRGF